jgi:DNA-binding beta-propeller fold protein YncE
MDTGCRYSLVSAVALISLSLAMQATVPHAASSLPNTPGSLAAQPPPVFVTKWGTNGTAEGQFDLPRGVAVDADGNVYVSDTLNHRVQKFDSDGGFLLMWGHGVKTGAYNLEVCTSGCQKGIGGTNDGQLFSPYHLAVDAVGNVYLANEYADRVEKFDRYGAFLLNFGTEGTTGGQFSAPRGVAVDSSGRVYVGDQVNERVARHNSDGVFLSTWGWGVFNGTAGYQLCFPPFTCQAGIQGSGDGQFFRPRGVAVDAAGNIYVADTENDRVQKFSGSNAVFQGVIGGFGYGEGEFTQPSDVAVDASGYLYVADGGWIQKFDPSGTFLVRWGKVGPGTGDGEFNGASGVAVDAHGNIYVADSNNHRIQKFGPALEVFVGEESPQPAH